MKRNIKVYQNGKYVEKEINYIPIRYIIAIMLAVIEIALIIGILVLLILYIPYFYIAMYITVFFIILKIISNDENPDYKVPWIVTVIALPIVGMMLYFMFSKRKLPKKIIKKLVFLNKRIIYTNHKSNLESLKNENIMYYTQALNLCKISNSNLYRNDYLTYYKLGEEMFKDMLNELKKANEFIFMEYFIISEGNFWNLILEILKEKAKVGIEVKVVYDDIGCMSTLPGSYYKELKKYNIDAIPFSKLKGTADGEFNNRSHRKILVIDGKVGFTGGINIADEYINEDVRFGHWKDTGIKIIGESVNELTRLFLIDYYLNVKSDIDINMYLKYTNDINNNIDCENNNYVIPFGDGPKPIYEKNVGKIAIMNLLNHATKYVYITTPYLIIDNELMRCIENTALRGVDVRIMIPHIPDKKLVFEMTKSSAEILMKSGVKVYEYSPGFIHAKSYIADDKIGMIGTINLDYRSLTHHFENGVWFVDDMLVKDIKEDYLDMVEISELLNNKTIKNNFLRRLIRSIIKLFSPLL